MDSIDTESKRRRIIALYLRGLSYSQIIQTLSHFKVNRSYITRTVSLYNKTGDIAKKKCGAKRTATSEHMVEIVRSLVQQDPCRKCEELAAELNISQCSMHTILTKRLGLKSFTFKLAQNDLTPEHKQNRLLKAKELLRLNAIGILPNIVFSGVTSFSNSEHAIPQNNRVYLPKDSTNLDFRMIARKRASMVMVWAAVTADGRSPLVFLNPKDEISSSIYLREILDGALKPWTLKHFDKKSWTFQQDSASYQKDHINQEWLKNNVPNYMCLTEWMTNSPDVNPLDFSIWDILKSKISTDMYQSVDTLKSAISLEWESISEDQIRIACNAFIDRLKAIVNANGDYIDKM